MISPSLNTTLCNEPTGAPRVSIPVPCCWSARVLLVDDANLGALAGEELAALIGAGATPVGLGTQRLRVETAAMALLSCVVLHADSLAQPDN